LDFFLYGFGVLNGNNEGNRNCLRLRFMPCRLVAKFPLDEREKAEEALKLYKDAQEMLRRFLEEKLSSSMPW